MPHARVHDQGWWWHAAGVALSPRAPQGDVDDQRVGLVKRLTRRCRCVATWPVLDASRIRSRLSLPPGALVGLANQAQQVTVPCIGILPWASTVEHELLSTSCGVTSRVTVLRTEGVAPLPRPVRPVLFRPYYYALPCYSLHRCHTLPYCAIQVHTYSSSSHASRRRSALLGGGGGKASDAKDLWLRALDHASAAARTAAASNGSSVFNLQHLDHNHTHFLLAVPCRLSSGAETSVYIILYTLYCRLSSGAETSVYTYTLYFIQCCCHRARAAPSYLTVEVAV